MAAEPLVLSEFDPSTGIARLVLNRPDALNAIDQSMAESFLAAVGTALERDGLRCVLISGAGRAFAAGGDVKAFSDPATAGQVIDAILRPMHEAVLALRRCPVPVVTAVRGIAAGGGFSLALCGDLVLAAEGTKFAVAYTRLGGTPDCGMTSSLSRRIGPAKTLELLLDDLVIDATRAKEMGIVTEVFPDASFEASVEERIGKLARGPTRAFAVAGRFWTFRLARRAAGAGARRLRGGGRHARFRRGRLRPLGAARAAVRGPLMPRRVGPDQEIGETDFVLTRQLPVGRHRAGGTPDGDRMTNAAFIVGYVRSPFTFAHKGPLAEVRPEALGAHVVRALVERTGVPGEEIEDVVWGCAFPEGEQGLNLGRVVALEAGLPISTCGMTINRCAAHPSRLSRSPRACF